MQKTEKERKCEKWVKKIMQCIVCRKTEENTDFLERSTETNCSDK